MFPPMITPVTKSTIIELRWKTRISGFSGLGKVSLWCGFCIESLLDGLSLSLDEECVLSRLPQQVRYWMNGLFHG